MLTFTELVKKAQEAKVSTPTEVIQDVVVNSDTISVGNKILENVIKHSGAKLMRTNKGWIKSVVRDIKKRNNIHPSKLNKISKYILSNSCSKAEYLMLGGDATKQLFQHINSGLDFQSAANMQYKESE